MGFAFSNHSGQQVESAMKCAAKIAETCTPPTGPNTQVQQLQDQEDALEVDASAPLLYTV